MKELLTYIARSLVDHPDSVVVTEHAGESETVLELRVAPEDMGKVIGTYNPLTQPAEIKVDAERAQAWIKTGAQPTETVKALLKKAGAI